MVGTILKYLLFLSKNLSAEFNVCAAAATAGSSGAAVRLGWRPGRVWSVLGRLQIAAEFIAMMVFVQAGAGREFRVVAAERDRQQRGRSRARQEEYTDTYRNIRHTVTPAAAIMWGESEVCSVTG